LRSAEQPSTYDYQVGGLTDGCSHIRGTLCRPLSLQALKLGSFLHSECTANGQVKPYGAHDASSSARGFICAAIDMTRLGSENITPAQWYKVNGGVMAEF